MTIDPIEFDNIDSDCEQNYYIFTAPENCNYILYIKGERIELKPGEKIKIPK